MADLKILEKINKIDLKIIYYSKKINDIENKLDKLNSKIELMCELFIRINGLK